MYETFSEAQKYTIHDEVNDAEIVAEHIMEGLNEGMFRVSSWEKE